ncbi:MAG: penicillin acylase family protein [Gemmatimonadetes bacterium]|nr:penicillin acylase family protein [Gemmatimonadota bacterium]
MQGGRGTLNPSVQSGGFGSSWRMVVELGPRIRAMGTYPGGQSGNPASPRYADRLRFWRDGDLELLIVPSAIDSLSPSQVSARLTLTPGGR